MFSRAYSKATSRLLLRKSSAALDDPEHNSGSGRHHHNHLNHHHHNHDDVHDYNPKLRLHVNSIYKRLDAGRREIRILEILPRTHFLGLDVDVVRCRVRTVSLDKRPPAFEALSWRQTSSLQDAEMELNGKLVPVPSGVRDLVKSLRIDTGTRSVWIDALCVNQDGDSEKLYHADLTRDIFSRAKAASVWLGAGSPALHVAFSSMRDIAAAAKMMLASGTSDDEATGPRALECVAAVLRQNAGTFEDPLAPLAELFGCPYWKEEATLRQLAETQTRITFLAGEASISGESVSQAVIVLRTCAAHLHDLRRVRQLEAFESGLLRLAGSVALTDVLDMFIVNARNSTSSKKSGRSGVGVIT